jgi:hypothetical protein
MDSHLAIANAAQRLEQFRADEKLRGTTASVMRGLDPRIHDAQPRTMPHKSLSVWHFIMDCRVRPGTDRGEAAARVYPASVKAWIEK